MQPAPPGRRCAHQLKTEETEVFFMLSGSLVFQIGFKSKTYILFHKLLNNEDKDTLFF